MKQCPEANCLSLRKKNWTNGGSLSLNILEAIDPGTGAVHHRILLCHCWRHFTTEQGQYFAEYHSHTKMAAEPQCTHPVVTEVDISSASQHGGPETLVLCWGKDNQLCCTTVSKALWLSRLWP